MRNVRFTTRVRRLVARLGIITALAVLFGLAVPAVLPVQAPDGSAPSVATQLVVPVVPAPAEAVTDCNGVSGNPAEYSLRWNGITTAVATLQLFSGSGLKKGKLQDNEPGSREMQVTMLKKTGNTGYYQRIDNDGPGSFGSYAGCVVANPPDGVCGDYKLVGNEWHVFQGERRRFTRAVPFRYCDPR